MSKREYDEMAASLEACVNKLFVYRNMEDEPAECTHCGFKSEKAGRIGVYDPGEPCPACGLLLSRAKTAMQTRVRRELSIALQNMQAER